MSQHTKQEWISVEEKLPERKVYGNEVLVVRKIEYGHRAGKVIYRRFVTTEIFKDGVFRNALVNEQVTHWMKLPEPPKTNQS